MIQSESELINPPPPPGENEEVQTFSVGSIFDGGNAPIDSKEEEAEVLALAFSLASREFFKNQYEHETKLEEAKILKKSGSLNVGLSLIPILLGIVLLLIFPGLFFAGISALTIGVIWLAYAMFSKYRPGTMKIEECTEALKKLRPEGKVEFVSKLNLPFYIVPYSQGSMVFDGAQSGQNQRIDLFNLPAEEARIGISDLETAIETFSNVSQTRQRLSAIDATQQNLTVSGERTLEQPIIDVMKKLKTITDEQNWIKQTIDFHLHRPETEISKTLCWLSPSAYPTKDVTPIATSYFIEQSRKIITDLKGVEAVARDADLVSLIANEWAPSIRDSTLSVEKRLRDNIENLNRYRNDLFQNMNLMVHRQLCPECIREILRSDWKEEYDLEKKLLKFFESSLDSMTLNAKETIETKFRNDIHADLITIRMKEHDIMFPNEGKLSLPQPTLENRIWHCEKHPAAKPEEMAKEIKFLSSYSDVFAHTGDRLWNELERPVLDKAYATNETATEFRQRYRGYLISLAPYEHHIDQLEVERMKIELALAEANKVLSSIDRKGH